ncbi:hypothetical protein [Stenotrophomonas sp. Iso1]|uniref:hypothetical protein n=1 Tax=Stenotrophomonas sp. Iso1 TaxID=2977283 RepID=UPI0022B7D398|nr:hypothetical protein [Stenotrophomonas sp. Iso1]
MTRATARLALSLLFFGTAGCSATTPSQTLQQRCAATPIDERVEIKIFEQGRLSACPPDAEEDCLYSLTAGKTYSAGTPDFNADGLPDQMIKHFGTNYGDVDVVHHLGFVQCGDGTAIKVLEGQFKEISVPGTITQPWPDLTATRLCAALGKEDASPQVIKLIFDPTTYRYLETPKLDPQSVCSDV